MLGALSSHAPLPIDSMIGIPQKNVWKAGFQKIHSEEGRFLNDRVEENVDRFAVTDRILKEAETAMKQRKNGSSEYRDTLVRKAGGPLRSARMNLGLVSRKDKDGRTDGPTLWHVKLLRRD